MQNEDPIIVLDVCPGGPFHNLNDPLEQAYERIFAFDKVTLVVEYSRFMSAVLAYSASHQFSDQERNRAKEVFDKAQARWSKVHDVKMALYFDLMTHKKRNSTF